MVQGSPVQCYQADNPPPGVQNQHQAATASNPQLTAQVSTPFFCAALAQGSSGDGSPGPDARICLFQPGLTPGNHHTRRVVGGIPRPRGKTPPHSSPAPRLRLGHNRRVALVGLVLLLLHETLVSQLCLALAVLAADQEGGGQQQEGLQTGQANAAVLQGPHVLHSQGGNVAAGVAKDLGGGRRVAPLGRPQGVLRASRVLVRIGLLLNGGILNNGVEGVVDAFFGALDCGKGDRSGGAIILTPGAVALIVERAHLVMKVGHSILLSRR
mmetsp:Transcript_51011/g.115953  ORF Transcript_51011/g.115953 Transcript_51011/m.115953 type:complete len:269 (-) Transcript_51011:412-1218(-)